jgi:hypothetical protein
MTRFEVKMPQEQRDALAELAVEAGVTSADLVRLAVGRLLLDRSITLPAAQQRPEAA